MSDSSSPSHASQDPAPEWASFFGTAERWDAFDSEVRASLKRLGYKAFISETTLRIVGPNAPSESTFGLLNLAQTCGQSPRQDWSKIIDSHFANMVRALDRSKSDFVPAFESVRESICVRLWDEADVPVRDVSICRTDLPGLLSVIVLDSPESIQTVRRDVAASWGVGDEELFAIAMANLERLAPVQRQEVDVGGGQRIIELFGESFFSASWALRIDETPEVFGPHGVFFATPTRHRLLTMPFTDLQSLQAMAMLMHAATGMAQAGPGTISPRVYWRSTRGVVEIPYAFGENRLDITPPDLLVELMEKLGG